MFSFFRSLISRTRARRLLEKKGFMGARKRLTPEQTFRHAAEKSRSLGFIILTLVWAVSIAVLVLPAPKDASILVGGQHAQKSIFADMDFSYEDHVRTEAKRDNVRALVPLFFRIDPAVNKACLERANALFDNPATGDNSPEKAAVRELLQLIQETSQRKSFLVQLEGALEEGLILKVDKEKYAIGQEMRVIDAKGRIRKQKRLQDVPTVQESADRITDNTLKYYSYRNRELIRKALSETIAGLLSGNLIYDEKVTDEERKKEADSISPVIVEFKKGDTIIIKDQLIDAKDLAILDAYSKQLKQTKASLNFWRKLSESSIVSLLLIVLTGLYLYHIHPEVVRSTQKMWLTGTAIILAIIANYLSMEFFDSLSANCNIPPNLILMSLPLGMAAVLLSVLIGVRVAIYAGLFVSIIAALMLGSSLNLLIHGLLLSCVAGFAVRDALNHRAFFVRAMLAVTLTMGLTLISYAWEFHHNLRILNWALLFCLINGVATAILSLMSLFFLESVFQVSTNMSLLLLCDYNHPLLKRLQLEAPGTYHHSLMVSTLAEQAAQEIDANPIRARVGALFHDIGKLSKPEYFAENNVSGGDPHKELQPRMSSLIIMNHVKEGVDLALKYKLKKFIVDTIEQHHGTDLVFYFYRRAVEENTEKDIPVGELEYRYPGPLPREKENVIVSLADVCEAASRSLQKPSHAKIDSLVWELFRKRIRDGQLNDADLTFGELAGIRESFVKTLTTMLHARIAYPRDEEEEDEDDLFMAAKRNSAANPPAPEPASGKS
ncbi:MAG: hypothetical protein A2X49_03180 [Lentisphaerae bacterium GWF2_52_8]|nr:MAG: hypothetical protein A2X49_03180 [Lentisphaerae bacterium GWF2_52_8]